MSIRSSAGSMEMREVGLRKCDTTSEDIVVPRAALADWIAFEMIAVLVPLTGDFIIRISCSEKLIQKEMFEVRAKQIKMTLK
jgi:hypothetical protein